MHVGVVPLCDTVLLQSQHDILLCGHELLAWLFRFVLQWQDHQAEVVVQQQLL